jgi:tetratricopeptide (TPR) repeat protein
MHNVAVTFARTEWIRQADRNAGARMQRKRSAKPALRKRRTPLQAAPDPALDQAQDLVYQAWDSADHRRQMALAKRALAISPLCADAYVILAGHARRGSDEELDLWRRAVEAGNKALGAAFDDYVGEFWGFLETRPYMRARCGLALALWARGARAEAIEHGRDMLRLNPGDNQGMRYALAAWLAEADRHDELAALFKAYPDDDSVHWSWTKALAAFRRGGDDAESRALLDQALAGNGHVAAYLLRTKRLPKPLPAFYSPGDEDEAILYAAENAAAWTRTPGALDWLRAHAPAAKPKRRPTRGMLQ